MTLPAGSSRCPTPRQMRATDRWAIEERGIPSLDSWSARARAWRALVGTVAPRGPVAIVCGKGNNGGDGFVAARLLRERGPRRCACCCSATPDELQGDAAENLERLPAEPPSRSTPRALDGAGGRSSTRCSAPASTGEPREPVAGRDRGDRRAPTRRSSPPTCPAASTPRPARSAGAAVARRRDRDVRRRQARACGSARARSTRASVRVVDIGIPDGRAGRARRPGCIDRRASSTLVPRRDAAGTKFSSGHVLVAGGSRGLTGAPVPRRRGGDARGRGLRHRARARLAEQPIFEIRLTEVDDARAARRRRRADVPHGADAVARGDRRAAARSCSGPGIGPRARRRSRSRATSPRAREVPLCSTPTASTPTPAALEALAARAAPTVLTPHAGELGAAARHRRATTVERAAPATARARPRAARRRSSCSRATTRSSPRPTAASPSTRCGAPALATAGTGDVLARRHRRAARARAWSRSRPPAPACASTPRPGRVAAAERGGPDGVIARDVIAALPAGDSAAAVASAMAVRCVVRVARVDLARDRAQRARACARELARRRRRCARSSRPTATATARCPRARAALAGGATLAGRRGGRTRRRELRDGGHRRVPILVMGALSPRGARRRARGAAPTSSPGDEAFVDGRRRAAAAARVHVKLDTGMGRLGTRDPPRRRASPRGRGGADGVELAGAMTHFATADERGDAFFGEQLARFARLGAAAARRAPRRRRCTPPTAPATLRDPASALRHGPRRRRDLRPGPVRRGPGRARPRARARAALLRRRRSSRSRRARAPATGGASSPSEPTHLATLPIGYGDGVRRALTNNADVLVARARGCPLVGTVSMDNVTSTSAPRRRPRSATRRCSSARRAASGSPPRRSRGGWARSTTRSPAGCCRACRAYHHDG